MPTEAFIGFTILFLLILFLIIFFVKESLEDAECNGKEKIREYNKNLECYNCRYSIIKNNAFYCNKEIKE
jgi:hypothetical protein